MVTTGLASNLGNGLEFRRFTVDSADLTTAGVSQAITLFTLPKGGAILGVRIKHSVAFTGGGASSCTASVDSTAGGAAYFAAAFDIFQAVAVTTFQMTTEFKMGTYAADVVTATFTADVNVADLTAGSVDIDILYVNCTTPL